MTIFKMDNGWTDHSTEGPVAELYEKECWSVCRGIGDKDYEISGQSGETFATAGTAEIAMHIVNALVAGGDTGRVNKPKRTKPKADGPKRFVAVSKSLVGGKVERHAVNDTVMQIEAFHWYGPTGADKCMAVAAALNALGHEKD